MLLRQSDITAAVGRVAEMISASGVVADVYTPPATQSPLGYKDSDYVKRSGTIAVQMKYAPNPTFSKDIDAECSVLPAANVVEGYHLVVEGKRYKVQTAASKRFGNALTHIVLGLVRLHG